MNVHRARDHGVGFARVHDVEQTVDRFVGLGAEQRRAEYELGFGVDQDLHEAECLVDDDESARIGANTRLVEPEIVRIRDASNSEEDVRAFDLRRILFAAYIHSDSVTALADVKAGGVEPEGDAFGLQNLLHCGGDVLILAAYDPRRHLDHGDTTAEAAIHLREFQADVAAADDDQVLGQEI